MGRQEATEDLQTKYAEVYAALHKHIGNADPRSYDKAMARMEESLMWAIKGVHNGNNEQR